MRKFAVVTAVAMAMTMMTASAAMAAEPTCANYELPDGTNTGWKNHGEHVTSGYATPGEPGGANGGPAHFGEHPLGASPGASFCAPGKNNAKELLHHPSGNVIKHGPTR